MIDTRTYVPLLTRAEIDGLSPRSAEAIEYRKSGLSLNHVMGCPLDCAYCIRHEYGAWAMTTPKAMMSDDEAVEALVGHPYFRPHATPLQIFNRATDPFLPRVRDHLFAVLEALDALGMTNQTLVITRTKIREQDCERLNALRHLRVTVLVTRSGITDKQIEPYSSDIAEATLKLAYEKAQAYRVVQYLRPLVPGLNDSDEHLAKAVELSHHAHATVFTGLFFRGAIAEYYREIGIPEPPYAVARRKILGGGLDARVVAAFRDGVGGPLFRKTSCGVTYAHGVADYNGHYGIRAELCGICPARQVERCAKAHVMPTAETLSEVAGQLPGRPPLDVLDISDRAVVLSGYSEQPRYFMQHALAFQVHDVAHPHYAGHHGRAGGDESV